jgi:hypothetical protein
VSQIVKSHRAGNGAGPKLHAAFRAASERIVWMPRCVTLSASGFAPTAYVLIALYHAGASERGAEDFLRIRLLGAHGPISGGKDPSAWRASEGVFKVGRKSLSYWNGIDMPALGGVSIVRTGDRQRATRKINIRLEQTT